MNMYSIIIGVNYGDIDDDGTSFKGYYIIIFSSYIYTLQADFIIYVQLTYSGKILCERNLFFSINISSRYYV